MTRAKLHLKSQLQRLSMLIIVLLFSGCASLQTTRINTDPLQQSNLLHLLEKANDAYNNKNWIEAENTYRSILTRMTKDEFSYFRLGNSLLWQGRLAEAVTPLKKAISINPSFNEARHNLSTAYILLAEQQMAELSHTALDHQKESIDMKRQHLTAAAAQGL